MPTHRVVQATDQRADEATGWVPLHSRRHEVLTDIVRCIRFGIEKLEYTLQRAQTGSHQKLATGGPLNGVGSHLVEGVELGQLALFVSKDLERDPRRLAHQHGEL